MSDLGDLISVGLLSQKDGLGLTANEAHIIAEDIASHVVGKGPFGELDVAWAEARAALREGADLAVSKTVGVQSGTHVAVSADAGVHAYADSPAAALRAFTAKLLG